MTILLYDNLVHKIRYILDLKPMQLNVVAEYLSPSSLINLINLFRINWHCATPFRDSEYSDREHHCIFSLCMPQ